MDAAERLEQQERATGRGSPELFGEALEAAEQATLLDPDAGPYWRLLGTLYATMRQDVLAGSLAEDALARAIDLDTRDAGARLKLAGLLMGRRAWSRALDQLEAAVGQDRRLLTRPMTVDMCHAYVADGLAERGEDFFRDVADEVVDPGAARLCLAVLLREQGPRDAKKAAEAIRVADQVAADAKANPEDAAYAKALAQDWRGGAR
jgi:lipopolysaccharide biosynthesis regulator YciM